MWWIIEKCRLSGAVRNKNTAHVIDVFSWLTLIHCTFIHIYIHIYVYIYICLRLCTGTGNWLQINRRLIVFRWRDQDSNPDVAGSHFKWDPATPGFESWQCQQFESCDEQIKPWPQWHPAFCYRIDFSSVNLTRHSHKDLLIMCLKTVPISLTILRAVGVNIFREWSPL